MKNLFTLLCFVAITAAATAQSNYRSIDPSSAAKLKAAPTSSIQKTPASQSSRAATYNLLLDYDGNDNTYADQMGYDYRGFLWGLNRNWTNTDNLNLDYAAVFFDSLQYVDQSGNLAFIPRAASTVTVDSFGVVFIHENTTGNQDTLTFTLFKLGTEVVTGYGNPNATFTTPALWDTVIYTNSSIPLNTQNYTVATFYPNIALAQGESFGIRVDFAGDTSNSFNIVAGYRDQCGDACAAETAISGNNSAYYLNFTQQTSNFSGYFENDGQGAIFYDCDQSNGFTVGGCENFYIQNIWIFSYVTVDVPNFGAAITADSLFTCPGRTLNLNAAGFGSTATPFTYSWTTTSGTLSSPTDQSTGLNVVGNAVVTVTIIDAAQDTATASINISSRGINITFTSANPLPLACGGTASITTAVTGTTTGRTYTWSTGATGGNPASTISVNTAGTYSVTVTNGSGCSASAAASVVYSNGATNTVTFTPPSPPVCKDRPQIFTNTSSNIAGWDATWNMGNSDVVLGTNATYTYNTLGFYTVTLEMDSAGCKFTSAPRTVQVTQCPNSIEDVSFERNISILPNPSNGNVTISVGEVEKYLNIRVYNIIGSLIRTYNTNEVSSSINRTLDLSDLANGTYLVKIETAGKTAVKRLTISK